MNMKRLVKPFLYATVVMMMSVSCKKEGPPPFDDIVCYDGTCCSPATKGRYRLARIVEGALAELSCGNVNCSLIFKGKITDYKLDRFPIEQVAGTRKISICPTTEHLVKGLPASFYANPDSVLNYRYRVWGKAYENIDYLPFIYPDFDFSLEKIEKIP